MNAPATVILIPIRSNAAWLTPERLADARDTARWLEKEQNFTGAALTINVLVAEIEALREAAKGALITVNQAQRIANQATSDKNVALLKASTLLIVAEKLAAYDLATLASGLRTARGWMTCDPECDDPEQFTADAALVDAILENWKPLQSLSDELHAAMRLVRG
jgi:hypothetical protein